MASLSNYLSIHMWIVENGAQMRLCDQFYDRLVLEPEMESNFSWTEPPHEKDDLDAHAGPPPLLGLYATK